MSPINDNYPTCSVITGTTGFTTGTTKFATTQSSEPNIIGAGNTVFYTWTPTDDINISFNTLFNPAITSSLIPAPRPNTALQAFTLANEFSDPTDVTQIAEVPYLPLTFNKWQANANRGGTINFKAAHGTQYFIRVDSVDTYGSSSVGDFSLSWGEYNTTFLNDCGGCAPKFGKGLVCMGTFEVPDVTLPPYDSVMASVGPGYYEIDYCAGAFQCQLPTVESYTVTFSDDQSGSLGGPAIWFAFNSGSAVVSQSLGGSPHMVYDTYVEAQTAFICAGNQINTTGGDLILRFNDVPFTDNANGTPSNPTFGIYYIEPAFRVTSACASWLTVGSVASVNLTILNETSGEWDPIYASFSGDITTTTPTRFAVGANSEAGITVTGTTSHTQVSPTLTLSSPYFASDITMPINLSPLLQIDNPGFGTSSVCFNGVSFLPVQIVSTHIHNRGNFFVNPTSSISMSNNVWMVSNSGCHTSSFANLVFEMECGAIRPIDGIQFANTSSVAVTSSLNFHLYDSTDDYGNITFPGFHI